MSSIPGREEPVSPKKPPLTDRVIKEAVTQEKAAAKQETKWPFWFTLMRQVVIFSLGVATIVYSIVNTQKNWAYVITGLFLLGLVPIENLMERWSRQKAKDEG
jgi:heme/copper-type cytochrome/quinol oxidase subunit 3